MTHTGGNRSGPPPHRADEDLRDASRQWAQDWMTVWQSELSTVAVDREAHEAWQAVAAHWADLAAALLGGLPPCKPHDPAAGGFGAARPHAAPRPPAAAAAPDPRDAEVEGLRERVAGLEQRLAQLERRQLERRRR
jgi:hypothetical protein